MTNKTARGILVGMVLGDGCLAINAISKNGLPTVRIQIVHGIKQIEYVEHKADLLFSALGGQRSVVKLIKNGKYPGVRLYKSDPYLRILRKWMYYDGKKYITRRILDMLTPQGLAIWWMDDGSLYMKRRDGIIHAREGILSTYLSLEENQVIAQWLLERYNVIAVPVSHKGKHRLLLNTTNLKRFVPIIEPYIIPSMRYKIDMGYAV